MPIIRFTVDSALLRELGERLVGKPYIALAELIKNSYDADATEVKIVLEPDKDRIVITDNGHGMDFDEFKHFWMRIGSPHKEKLRTSRKFKRLMTGSKGVGRLAVQYLAKNLVMTTISDKKPRKELRAEVEWMTAVSAGDLTKATVEYGLRKVKPGSRSRTKIVLTGLKHGWDQSQIRGLAQEIWWLQPPFRSSSRTMVGKRREFRIRFRSSEESYVKVFNRRLSSILDIWHAKLVGRNDHGSVSLSLQFKDQEPIKTDFKVNLFENDEDNRKLQGGDFEIRIYHLLYRQPGGIRVGDAREYFNTYGGVHVYDGGFHLPYYGNPKNDWLAIEVDHSHRLGMSKLLPAEYRISDMLTFLPTLSRVFGVVNVDTSKEFDLNILITRDRLQDTKGLRNLVFVIRWALDFYAYHEKKRTLEYAARELEVEMPEIRRFEDVLTTYAQMIEPEVYENLRTDLRDVTHRIELMSERMGHRLGLISSLATAGISSLAYQHEIRQQFSNIEHILERLDGLESQIEERNLRNRLKSLREDLSSWVRRAKAANSLFSHLSDLENVEVRKRFRAERVVKNVRTQVGILSRGIPIETDKVNDRLLLPKASFAEWSSIFQNVFINAFNALVDSEKRLVEVSSRVDGRDCEILVQDTGVGVDLANAKDLFEPFVRKLVLSPERRALGYGGTGLGLTIVRMIANDIGCDVSFVEPDEGFNTAFSLSWREAA